MTSESSKVRKVAILGAGNGGITAAADLADRGFKVALYELPDFKQNLEVIKEKGGITQKEPGKKDVFVEIDEVTTDMAVAIKDAQIVMLTIPGFAVRPFCEKLAPIIDESQMILFNGAASMGCVRFVEITKELGIKKDFLIAETNSLTYGTRGIASEAVSELLLRVKKIFLAAYPHTRTDEALSIASQIYDCFVPAENIIHTTLENGNPEVHPGPCLMNAGRIDYSNGEFYFYKEGITKHTLNILHGVEKERTEVGKAYGLDLEDAMTSRSNRGYFDASSGKDLQTLFNTSPVYTPLKGPVSVHGRYIVEDISDGLVLWSDLGKLAGVETPVIDAIITLGSQLLLRDFFAEGLTLDKLGLHPSSVDDLLGSI